MTHRSDILMYNGITKKIRLTDMTIRFNSNVEKTAKEINKYENKTREITYTQKRRSDNYYLLGCGAVEFGRQVSTIWRSRTFLQKLFLCLYTKFIYRPAYQTAWRHVRDDSNLQSHSFDPFTSQKSTAGLNIRNVVKYSYLCHRSEIWRPTVTVFVTVSDKFNVDRICI